MSRTGQKLFVLRMVGRPTGWVAGSNENNANSASVEVEVEVEAELGNTVISGSRNRENGPKY